MTSKSEPKHQFQLEVFWGKGGDLPAIFADNVTLQQMNDQYYLTFGQVQLPLEQASDRVVAEIKPVARIVVASEAFKKMLALFQAQPKAPGT